MAACADRFDAVVVGGGPAGACAAIRLATSGARVLLAERKRFPRAKLCGEFISPECLPIFRRLGVLGGMEGAGGARLRETVFYSHGGHGVGVRSEWFGGAESGAALGLSRAEMDRRLLDRAREAGAEVIEEAALSGLLYEGGRVSGVRLNVAGCEFVARALVTVDASGRQRAVARRAAREEGQPGGSKRAPLVAFKAHLEGAGGRPGVCEIYFYRGGYGGLSEVEGGLSNLCFIARARDVRAYRSDADRVMREVLMRNRRAAETLSGARARTEWLGAAIEGFGRRGPVPAAGVLAAGDAAAFIDPFAGSGMLMALESGELAAVAISDWLPGARSGRAGFSHLARAYASLYASRFDARLRVCGLLRRAAFSPPPLADMVARALGASEGLRRLLARATRPCALAVTRGRETPAVD